MRTQMRIYMYYVRQRSRRMISEQPRIFMQFIPPLNETFPGVNISYIPFRPRTSFTRLRGPATRDVWVLRTWHTYTPTHSTVMRAYGRKMRRTPNGFFVSGCASCVLYGYIYSATCVCVCDHPVGFISFSSHFAQHTHSCRTHNMWYVWPSSDRLYAIIHQNTLCRDCDAARRSGLSLQRCSVYAASCDMFCVPLCWANKLRRVCMCFEMPTVSSFYAYLAWCVESVDTQSEQQHNRKKN